MKTHRVYNVNIVSETVLPTPEDIKTRLPLNAAGQERIYGFRETIKKILKREDGRLLGIVGPCSIHHVESAVEYGRRLKDLADECRDVLVLIMRVYFEKPRSTLGWKGLINDPRMDNSFHMEEGLFRARQLLLELAGLGLPAATEALDPIVPQYIGDLISWTSVGARTSESQTHREMASGLSTPVGFKNATDGDMDVAVNALLTVSRPHHFLGITQKAQCAMFHTMGNPDSHIVLRGGAGVNYDPESIARCERRLAAAGLPPRIVVDCSHGNAMGDPLRQVEVLDSCVRQILDGSRSIAGFMMESNLLQGKQAIPEPPGTALPGLSVTDACIDWPTTENCIRTACRRLRECAQRSPG